MTDEKAVTVADVLTLIENRQTNQAEIMRLLLEALDGLTDKVEALEERVQLLVDHKADR